MAKFLIAFTLLSISASARNLDQLYEKAGFKLGSQKIHLYIADDDSGREQGLMYIEKMPEDTGMLFVFEQERPLAFWMKNTLMPLAIAFLDEHGKIVDIQEMQVASSILNKELPTYKSARDARFALEMNSGWYARHKIKVGTKLELLSSTKSKLLKAALVKTPLAPRQ